MRSDSLGLAEGQFRHVEYDERWPAVFGALRDRLVDHLGHRAESVHHAIEFESTTQPSSWGKIKKLTGRGTSPN